MPVRDARLSATQKSVSLRMPSDVSKITVLGRPELAISTQVSASEVIVGGQKSNS